MRGSPDRQLSMLSSLSTEDLIPEDHPIRRIRAVVDTVPAGLDDDFEAMYATSGRRSVPPEQLLKATVLMAMYSMRSERAFCERLNYDMLFKWFLDLPIDGRAFDATTFTKNRQRLLDHEIADRFFAAVVAQAKLRRYMSPDHFSVDGTLLQAWASNKSFKPDTADGDDSGDSGDSNGFKGRNAEVDFKGQKRSNKTHTSTTDPDAMLFRKSNNAAAELSYMGHLLIENRSALIVDADLTQATGFAERDCATDMLRRLPKRARRRTVAGDKNYDTKDFVADVRGLGFTPHVAQNNTNRRSAIDGRTTRHAGHVVSQRIRKRVEEPFGWIKTVGAGRKLRYIGPQRNRAWFKMEAAVYNLIRICSLDATAAG
ncbi:MAG: IS5 family transposase [Ilumatobacter sp.]|uniref:IS5 family transposase n=1 Tax=Ilumatobacter sp. TaxID=1967498 RepID=UPI00391B5836